MVEFDIDAATCPKCGCRFIDHSHCDQKDEEILKDSKMEWKCECGFVYIEQLNPEEILELEEEYRHETHDLESKE